MSDPRIENVLPVHHYNHKEVGMRHKTGEKALTKGSYVFDGYVNAAATTAKPTSEERVIPLDKGDTFAPIRSTSQAAYWKALD